MNRKAKLQQAAQLGKTGDVNAALTLLYELVEHDNADKAAWWGIAATSTNSLEKRRAVAQVLQLDPNHAKALDLQARLDEAGVPRLDTAATAAEDNQAYSADDDLLLPPDLLADEEDLGDLPDLDFSDLEGPGDDLLATGEMPDLSSYDAPSLEGTQDISDELADVLHADLDLTDEEDTDWLSAVEDTGEVEPFGDLEPVNVASEESFDDWLTGVDADDAEVPAWLEESSSEMRPPEPPEPGAPAADAVPDWMTATVIDDDEDAMADDDSDWLTALAAADDADREAIQEVTGEFASEDLTPEGFGSANETPTPADDDRPDIDTAAAYTMADESLLDAGDQEDMVADFDFVQDNALEENEEETLILRDDLEGEADLLLSQEMEDSSWLQDYESALEDLESPGADVDLYDGLQRPNDDDARDDSLPDDVPAGADIFDDVVADAAPPAVEDWLTATESSLEDLPVEEVPAAEPLPVAETELPVDDDDDELALLGETLLSDDDLPPVVEDAPTAPAEDDAALDWMREQQEMLDAELPLADDAPSVEDPYLATDETEDDTEPAPLQAAASTMAGYGENDDDALRETEAEADLEPLDADADDWMRDLPTEEPPSLEELAPAPPAPPEMPPELPALEATVDDLPDSFPPEGIGAVPDVDSYEDLPAPGQTEPAEDFDFAAAFASASDNLDDDNLDDDERLETDELEDQLDAYLPDSVRGFHNSVENVWKRDLGEAAEGQFIANDTDDDDSAPLHAANNAAAADNPEITPQPEPATSVVRYEDTPQEQFKPAWYEDPEKRVQVAAGAAVGLVVVRFIVRALFGGKRG